MIAYFVKPVTIMDGSKVFTFFCNNIMIIPWKPTYQLSFFVVYKSFNAKGNPLASGIKKELCRHWVNSFRL